ncbi:MAG: helix-turn-helix transcriptional regulator [Proteiniphilum sp.]
MEMDNYTNTLHIGRKIERIRRLRGMTQSDLGDILGVTKQAVSKMEQTEQMEDGKIKQIAEALGVTEEGLKKFSEETVLYYTNNFYENSNATATNIGTVSSIENLNQFSMEQAIKLFEELIKIEREKFDSLKKEKE